MKFSLRNIDFAYHSKVLGAHHVFSDLSLTIETGSSVLIVGEEGCGKSTLLQLLNGLQRPDGGNVWIDETEMWKNDLPSLRRRIGFAFQFPEQQCFCEKVRDELLFGSRNYGTTVSEEALKEAMLEVGLRSEALEMSPFALSMGEMRRLAFAGMIIRNPDAFLLDEPTAGLDGFGIALIHRLMGKWKRVRKTIVVATHAPEIFLPFFEKVIVLNLGGKHKEYSADEFSAEYDPDKIGTR